MLVLFIVAAVLIPFLAEYFAVPMSGNEQKRKAFYWLTPLMGAVVYTSFLAITGHAYLALSGSALFYFGLTGISNTKYQILRDPFNTHDFDNARNLYIYPEFYVTHVGWPIVAVVVAVFATGIAASLYFEPALGIYSIFGTAEGAMKWVLAAGSWLLVLLGWLSMLWLTRLLITLFFNENTRAHYEVSIDPIIDVARFGLFPTMMLYRLLLKTKIDKQPLRDTPMSAIIMGRKPADIIALQGESYFDLDRFFGTLPSAISKRWQPLGALEDAGVVTGQIEVPCWGAYTMQTEFSFLSRIKNHALGIDRINPYMRFAQKRVSTFAHALRDAGYRTVCVHPARREFFRRSDVMANLGFDEFIGLEAFPNAPSFGNYISDAALAEKIEALIAEHRAASDKPLFVFAITIESHGPWIPGRLSAHLPAGITETDLAKTNITGNLEFALYQQHMENLLAFYRRLSIDHKRGTQSRIVALYGDHMPAFGDLFDAHNFAGRDVDFLLWNSERAAQPLGTQRIEDFAKIILKEAGVSLI